MPVRSPRKRRLSFLYDSSSSMRCGSSEIRSPGTSRVRWLPAECSPEVVLLTPARLSTETAITPQIFASHLCADLRLPREPFEREIVNAVSRQLADAQISVNYTDHLADPLTESREEGRVWLERHATKRRRVQRSSASGTGRSGGAEATPLRSPPHDLDDAASVTSVEELEDGKNYAAPTDELRLVIKVGLNPSEIFRRT